MFKKQTEEMKNVVEDVKVSFGDNVKNIVKESKLMIFLAAGMTCLVTGFIMGSVTTAAMTGAIQKLNNR